MIKAPKSTAFYLRVSTVSQDYPSQMLAIKEFCAKEKILAPRGETVFSEKASGATVARRELDLLLQACRRRQFDCIITYRVDRMARSLRHMANIYAELKALKVRLIGVADGIDTADDSPASNALRNMLATFAELTRETIVENTRDGLAAAAKRGKFPGRPRRKQKQILQAFRLKAAGKSHSEIHRRTGLSLGYVSDLMNGKNKPGNLPGEVSKKVPGKNKVSAPRG